MERASPKKGEKWGVLRSTQARGGSGCLAREFAENVTDFWRFVGCPCDGWVMLDHLEMDMGEGQISKGLGLWTWDPKPGE